MNRVGPRELIERELLVSSDLDESDQLKLLWISKRVLRVAECQDVVERINEQISEYRDVDDEVNPYDPDVGGIETLQYDAWEKQHKKRPIPAMLLKMKLDALRLAAEELGQLPNETPASPDSTKYAIIGVDPEALK